MVNEIKKNLDKFFKSYLNKDVIIYVTQLENCNKEFSLIAIDTKLECYKNLNFLICKTVVVQFINYYLNIDYDDFSITFQFILEGDYQELSINVEK